MLGRAAGLVVATASCCALGVHSFLLPPGANSFDDSLLSAASEETTHQSVRIPCAECAFSTKQEHVDSGDEIYRIEGGAHELLLDFTTSEDETRLQVNGADLYPSAAWQKEDAITVYQVPAGDEDVRIPLKVTSNGLMIETAAHGNDPETSLVQIRFAVLGVEDQLMELPTVQVDVLQHGEKLLLLRANVNADEEEHHPYPPPHHGPPGFRPHFGRPPFRGPPPPEMTNAKECATLPAPICRFKHMLEAKMGRKPCLGRMGMGGPPHGGLPSHIRPPMPHLPAHGEYHHPPPPHFGRPHHMRPWHARPHHHHDRHHHGHWAGAFVRGFVAVLLPIAAGISVGLTVSLLGLLFGRLVAWAWFKIARRDQRGAGRDEQEVEEGKGLMSVRGDEEDEQLPAYEDAPPYEAGDGKDSH